MEAEKNKKYEADKAALGGLQDIGASLWSWGAKAAEAATELSKEVAEKATELSGASLSPYAPLHSTKSRPPHGNGSGNATATAGYG